MKDIIEVFTSRKVNKCLFATNLYVHKKVYFYVSK